MLLSRRLSRTLDLRLPLPRLRRALDIRAREAERLFCLLQKTGIDRTRLQDHILAKAVREDAKSGDPAIGFVVRWDQVPRRVSRRGFLYHVLDRGLVIGPARAIPEILIRQLPALHGIEEPVAEAAFLFVRCDVQE